MGTGMTAHYKHVFKVCNLLYIVSRSHYNVVTDLRYLKQEIQLNFLLNLYTTAN